MKCDGLKRFWMGDPAIGNEYEMYRVADVDEAITELKEKIKELEAKLEEEREFGLNRAKSADHEIGKMCVEIKDLKDKLRHYPMMVALIERDKKEIEERNAIYQKSLARLEELVNKERPDKEEDHIEADDILCDMLNALGYKDLTEACEKLDKWYC